MSDRERLPRPAVRRPVDPGAAWAEVEKTRDERMGAGQQCESCFHCYVYPVTPDTPPQHVCHEGPAHAQFVQNQAGMALQTVPRVVNGNFFCHRWRTRN